MYNARMDSRMASGTTLFEVWFYHTHELSVSMMKLGDNMNSVVRYLFFQK
jgi:hypothetical protein